MNRDYLVLLGLVSKMSAAEQATIGECILAIKTLVEEGGDLGIIALSIIGAELSGE